MVDISPWVRFIPSGIFPDCVESRDKKKILVIGSLKLGLVYHRSYFFTSYVGSGLSSNGWIRISFQRTNISGTEIPRLIDEFSLMLMKLFM
jgi:hypothetical protein